LVAQIVNELMNWNSGPSGTGASVLRLVGIS